MGDGGERLDTRKEAYLRRMALQLSAQLPEDAAEARRVLELMQTLQNDYLTVAAAPPPAFNANAGGGKVVMLRTLSGPDQGDGN